VGREVVNKVIGVVDAQLFVEKFGAFWPYALDKYYVNISQGIHRGSWMDGKSLISRGG
jgi:hypothetical protein